MAAPNLQLSHDKVPGYYECGNEVYTSISKYLSNSETEYLHWPLEFYEDLKTKCKVSYWDIIWVIGLSILLTKLRSFFTKYIFLPFGHYFDLTKSNKKKLPESAWKAMFCTCAWSYTVYILCYSGNHDFYHRPLHMWNDWKLFMDIPMDIYVIYVVQFSFYIHSVYGTIFLDQWRKDSMVMLFHHFLTLALLALSFAARHHNIGMVVLLLHDVADIFLEFTKCNVYLKERGGKIHYIHEYISTAGFIGFASSWYYFRLYLFPLKVLYSTGYGTMEYAPNPPVPFYFIFNCLLWILQILNIYWFMFIVNFLIKVATGQMKEVNDVREEEVMKKITDENKKRSGTVIQGNGTKLTSKKKKKTSTAYANGDAPVTNGYKSSQNGYAAHPKDE